MEELVTFLIYGAVQSSIYALLALGYSLVYGVGKILNLAHGAFYIIASYIFYWIWISVVGGFGFLLGMVLSLVIVTIVGMVSYLIIIKPLQDHEISVLIGTFGLAFFIEQLMGFLFDPRTKSIGTIWNQRINFFGVGIILHRVIVIFSAIVIVLLLILFINKSKIGKSIRAVSQDREAATLVGINVNRMLMYTLMISAFLAGFAAILNTPLDRVAPYIGWIILTDSIAIVILGGMGSLSGSLVGAFILGYVRIFTNFFIDPVISTLMPIVVLAIILLVRPRGLFGKKEID